jgi:hypothetical protein
MITGWSALVSPPHSTSAPPPAAAPRSHPRRRAAARGLESRRPRHRRRPSAGSAASSAHPRLLCVPAPTYILDFALHVGLELRLSASAHQRLIDGCTRAQVGACVQENHATGHGSVAHSQSNMRANLCWRCSVRRAPSLLVCHEVLRCRRLSAVSGSLSGGVGADRCAGPIAIRCHTRSSTAVLPAKQPEMLVWCGLICLGLCVTLYTGVLRCDAATAWRRRIVVDQGCCGPHNLQQ